MTPPRAPAPRSAWTPNRRDEIESLARELDADGRPEAAADLRAALDELDRRASFERDLEDVVAKADDALAAQDVDAEEYEDAVKALLETIDESRPTAARRR